MAGGPPWLCLPIDGVTSENAKACHDLLSKALNDKVWIHSDRPDALQLRQEKNQWYLTFYMQQDVGLSDIDEALHGSDFSVSRDNLHLFGHVVLDIESRDSSANSLQTDLDKLPYVAITEANQKDNHFSITVDMPYPNSNAEGRESLNWETFRWTVFSSDKASRSSDAPAKAADLPTAKMLQDTVAKHNAKLKDIRWSTNYACRPLGGVGVEDADTVAATTK